MEVILGLILVFCEIIVLNLIANIFLQPRWKESWKYVLCIGVQCLCTYGLEQVCGGDIRIFVASLAFLILTFLSISYCGMLWKKIVCVVSYLVFEMTMDSLGIIIVWIWDKEIFSTFSGVAIVSLLNKGVECLIAFILSRICGKQQYRYQISRNVWFQFLWFPVMTLVIITVLLVEGGWKAAIFLIISAVLLLSNFCLYFLLAKCAKKEGENRELLLQTQQIQRQAELYDSLQNSYLEQRARAHEFQGYLGQIQNLLRQRQIAEAEHYLEKVNEKIENRRKYYKTSNAIIDALINEKYRQAKKEGIVLSLKLADLSKINMPEKNLVYIFTFLLDGVLHVCGELGCRMVNISMEKEEEWQIIASISSEDRRFQEAEQKVWEQEMTKPILEKLLEHHLGETFCYSSENSLIYQISFYEHGNNGE